MASLDNPIGQLCTQAQIEDPIYQDWVHSWNHAPAYHRKQWEFVYICQVLRQQGLLEPGRKGLGFGVGREPLASIFATYGVDSLATDIANEKAGVWRHTDQHASLIQDLVWPEICSRELLEEHLLGLLAVDMNHIPLHLQQHAYDFVWSACSLDHLGSLQHGLDFIRNSLLCLKPGGIGVYTTEFNLSSETKTIEKGSTVVYRRADLEKFAEELWREGYEPAPFDFDRGNLAYDNYIDQPPYKQEIHLRLRFHNYIITSVGWYIKLPA